MAKGRYLPAVGIVVVTFLCVWTGSIPRLLFFLALSLASVFELYSVFLRSGERLLWIVPGAYLVGQALLCLFCPEPLWMFVWFALMAFCALFKVVLCPSCGARSAFNTLFTMLWPVFFYGILMALAVTEKAGVVLALTILTVWGCDSTALFVGRGLGKHKLAPYVSPNKTWEGTIGGALFSLLAGALLCLVLRSFDGPSLLPGMTAAFVGSCFGQAGDLIASLFKRMCGVKDYSRLLGEHGGIMDKMDGMLFAIPAAWLVLHLFAYV